MLLFMVIILLSGIKPCTVISKAVSYDFMFLVTVLFQKKWTKKLILPLPFGLRIGKVLIITWFRNTSIPSIVDEFGNLDIAEEVWDLLVTRYAGSSGARNFKFTRKLYQIRQEPGERITVYHGRLKSIWDQLIASEPVLSNSADTKLLYVHRE